MRSFVERGIRARNRLGNCKGVRDDSYQAITHARNHGERSKNLAQELQPVQALDTGSVGVQRVAKLPAQITGFVGREKDLAEVCRLLETVENCRLLSLVGPGGMGKTRLALEAATRLQSAYPDGVYFVPLAPLSEVEEVVPAIVQALDLVVYGNTALKTQLLKYLEDKQLFLSAITKVM